MKTSAPTLSLSSPAERSWAATLSDLFKARLTLLVLLTTSVGFYVGAPGNLDWSLMLQALAGTGLLACGASALNQWLEREPDAKMRRTATRPLPSGRLQPNTVLALGSLCCLAGLLSLALAVNGLTTLLGAMTAGIYLFVYTPLKRVSWLNTLVGAIPGALPPLMGWTAARNDLAAGGLAMFALQFCWQVPHFLAIAWMYREDYARAGFQMLPLVERGGQRTAHHATGFAVGLLAVSLCPALLGLAGVVYLAGALLLGMLFAGTAFLFAQQLSLGRARQLFLASIVYLPLLLALLVFDRLRSL